MKKAKKPAPKKRPARKRKRSAPEGEGVRMLRAERNGLLSRVETLEHEIERLRAQIDGARGEVRHELGDGLVLAVGRTGAAWMRRGHVVALADVGTA